MQADVFETYGCFITFIVASYVYGIALITGMPYTCIILLRRYSQQNGIHVSEVPLHIRLLAQ